MRAVGCDCSRQLSQHEQGEILYKQCLLLRKRGVDVGRHRFLAFLKCKWAKVQAHFLYRQVLIARYYLYVHSQPSSF